MIKPIVPDQQKETKQKQTETVEVTPQSTYRTTSIKALGKSKDTKTTSLNGLVSQDANSTFTQNDLVKYWIEYAKSLSIEHNYLKNTLISCQPEKKENHSFEISVFNPSQKDEIEDNKAPILAYLSNKLNNSEINMDIFIVEKEAIEMIYTAVEKYDYLKKKNVNIEKLKEVFNLTLD